MTIMWIIVIIVIVLASLLSLLYLASRISTYSLIRKIAKDKKWLSILLSLSATVMFILLVNIILNYVNAAVVICTVLFMSLIGQLIFFLLKTVLRKKASADISSYRNKSVAVIAIAGTLMYLSIGWYNAHHVVVTEYTVVTKKEVAPIKIAVIGDLHVGTTFNGNQFVKHAKLIESLNPDMIMIVGDFIDGSSNLKNTSAVCNAIGEIKTSYGTYFCYGNHDKNVYNEDSKRDFTSADLARMLEKNGVTILEDESITTGNGCTIIGRRDKSDSYAKEISELISDSDLNNFVIDLNHQPYDYDNEAKEGIDLVLSGHTHGGQLFPIRRLGELISSNCKTYGIEKRDNTTFIVTSGISDWAVDFKTGCKSEIVVVNIVNK